MSDASAKVLSTRDAQRYGPNGRFLAAMTADMAKKASKYLVKSSNTQERSRQN